MGFRYKALGVVAFEDAAPMSEGDEGDWNGPLDLLPMQCMPFDLALAEQHQANILQRRADAADKARRIGPHLSSAAAGVQQGVHVIDTQRSAVLAAKVEILTEEKAGLLRELVDLSVANAHLQAEVKKWQAAARVAPPAAKEPVKAAPAKKAPETTLTSDPEQMPEKGA